MIISETIVIIIIIIVVVGTEMVPSVGIVYVPTYDDNIIL